MNKLTKQYEQAKSNSKVYMQNGQIAAYLNALLEMNKYKRLMVAVVAN
jgi:hypothetical protein